MRYKLLFVLVVLFNLTALAQNPVHFSVQQKQISPTEVDVIFTGKINSVGMSIQLDCQLMALYQQPLPQKKLKELKPWANYWRGERN